MSGAAPLDKEIVSSVYAKYLSRPARGRAATSCLVALELSGYLERYLWPHLAEPAAASWEHVMSIVALVNLKAREGAPAWAAFSAEPERFASLFSRVLDLPTEQPRWSSASYDAKAAWTAFFVNAFAALEDGMVRAQALRLVSLPMWATLAPKHQQQQLASQPQLGRPWKFLTKRAAKEAKMESPPPSSRQERDFIPSLLRAFLKGVAVAGGEGDDDDAMADADDNDDDNDDGDVGDANGAAVRANGDTRGGDSSGIVRYLERTLELIIDLLAQLPTRRFFHAVVLDQHGEKRSSDNSSPEPVT